MVIIVGLDPDPRPFSQSGRRVRSSRPFRERLGVRVRVSRLCD